MGISGKKKDWLGVWFRIYQVHVCTHVFHNPIHGQMIRRDGLILQNEGPVMQIRLWVLILQQSRYLRVLRQELGESTMFEFRKYLAAA